MHLCQKCTPRSFQFGTVDADSVAGRIKLLVQCADSPERTQSTLNKRAWEKPTVCLLINELSEIGKTHYAADAADFPCWPLARRAAAKTRRRALAETARCRSNKSAVSVHSRRLSISSPWTMQDCRKRLRCRSRSVNESAPKQGSPRCCPGGA